MPSFEKNIEIFLNFGLTRNQAKVYMAVSRLRLAPVGQISKVSKVRREDVYRILPKLEEMGLVEKLMGTPIKIRATPVEEALSILIKSEEDTSRERLSALKVQTRAFVEQFAAAPKLEVEEKANFVLLSKREGITSRGVQMLKSAEKEVDIVGSRNKLMQFIFSFAGELKRILKKGGRVRIITGLPEYEDSLPRIIEEHISPGNFFDLRCVDKPSSHYMIVDFEEALISTTTEGNMAENPCLWTNSDSLIGVFQEAFENLWHSSVSWRSVETAAVAEKVIDFMEELRPTNHLIFVYDSPEAKYNVLFNYLKAGLDNHEATVYVAAEESPDQIKEAMKRFGIQVQRHEKTKALRILGYEEVYIKDGKFRMATTMETWNKLYSEALKQGFKGLRVTGEMACFFQHSLVQELLEYERALHRVLDIPMVAMCAYSSHWLNRSKDPINLYGELARAHGTVLFTGIDSKLGRMEIRGL